MEVTYFGHSCFLLDMGGTKVLFDPFITYNSLASEVDKEAIEADFILVSHAHQDHMADAEYFAKKSNGTIVAIYEVCEWYKAKGIENVVHMNIGGKADLPFGTVKMVTAAHSSVLPDGTYGGNPGGYVVESGDKTFYFAGDTGLTYDMKIIAEQYHLDFAFLPIGGRLTMDIYDAVTAANWVNTKKIIGMHFDTWPNIEIDHIEAMEAARQAGKELVLMQIGEKINL
ncbi:metal-dependent hydrolase [Adhaeribacter aquaticus]|uniref:metal-dependent hydrolase n=1 Tax=Adhaeribacter aquaticus TaxID=299567 RepID=UPI0004228F4F|nr:metal-dependent hydrolase [Adhaeribacter aquaticus]